MDVLHLATEHVDGATVVLSVGGELDVATTPRFRRTVAELVSLGHNRLVLDLGGLSFIDSTGIGAFIATQNRVREASGSLVLRSVSARVCSVLSIGGLDGVLEIESDDLTDITDERLALR